MADASQLQLNPYALFDPSQWANPYSNYQSSPLPGASYAGVPTNYAGQPIQMPAGMTINQTPSQPQAAAPPAAAQQASQYIPLGASIQNGNVYTPDPSGRGWAYYGRAPQAAAQPTAAPAAAPASAPTNNAGLTPQQYMALRANPGPVPTYGATVPQSASSAQPGTGVLQSFLQNWKPASSGVGSGFQQGFSSALKGMGYG